MRFARKAADLPRSLLRASTIAAWFAAAWLVLTPQSAAAQVLSGSYTGDGTDNRAIGQLGFQPDVVIVKGNTTQIAVIRTSSMSGDNSKPMTGATGLTANLIQSLDSSGFTVGSDARVNSNGVEYYWIAFKQGTKRLEVGSYAGNGANPRTISGLGVSPDFLIVVSAVLPRRCGVPPRTRNHSTSGRAAAAQRGSPRWVPATFTVTNDTRVNASGTTYHYIAWNEVGGVLDVGSYTGNGADNRNITGVGFQPE